MAFTIEPKLSPSYDYNETFFDGLKILVSERQNEDLADQNSIPNLIDNTEVNEDRSKHKYEGRIRKSFRFEDRRKKPVEKEWTLSYLIMCLGEIAQFGDITDPKQEDHSTFVVTNERPEDKLTFTRYGTVFWNEWRFHPVFERGKYLSLPPIVAALKDIQNHIDKIKD
jgi:hypothetical protein